jgi:hypothetical protein
MTDTEIQTVVASCCPHEWCQGEQDAFEAALKDKPGYRIVSVRPGCGDQETYVVAEMTRKEVADLLSIHSDFDRKRIERGCYGITLITADGRVGYYGDETDYDQDESDQLLEAVMPGRFARAMPMAIAA